MSIALHRSGLATVLSSVTGVGAGKLAQVFKWPHRNLADTTLKYPFAAIDESSTRAAEDYSTVGQGGLNRERLLTRILIFDTYADTETQYNAFVTTVEAVLTALRKDSNLRLGQDAQGCTGNWIVNYSIKPVVSNTPAILLGTIDCLGTYTFNRT